MERWFIDTSFLIALIHVSGNLLENGLALFERRLDKEWSLADCVSFEVMAQRNLACALTTDAHFAQTGFVALLNA